MLNMFLQFLFTAGVEARPLRECTRTRSTPWMLIFVVGVGKVMLAKLAGASGRESGVNWSCRARFLAS